MYLVPVSVFLFTLFYTPCLIGAFEWTDSLPNGAKLEVCEGNNAIFPWGFHLAPGEQVNTVSYHKQLQYETTDIARKSGQRYEMGTPIVSTDPHFTFTPDHQMIINRAIPNDTGNYVIKVMVVPAQETETEAQPHVTKVSLLVKVTPVLEEEGPGLQAKLQPQAVMVTDGPQPGWHVQLSCGTFLSLGQPAVTVTWSTRSGIVLRSTSYESGVFSLIVPNPVESGYYSCQVDPQAPVLACVNYKSPLLAQPTVRVDVIEARVILLEARENELTARNTELTARETELTARDTEQTARITELTTRDTELTTRDTEQTARITEQTARITEQTARITELTARLEDLAKLVAPPKVYSNVAAYRPATQSSTHNTDNPRDASNAVDLHFITDMHDLFFPCTHTGNGDDKPWWRVDLGEAYNVTVVLITNRGDCCGDRLRNFYVDVLNDDPASNSRATAVTCFHYKGVAANGVTLALQCSKPTRGRYVRVRMSTAILQLCEVQVMAPVAVLTP